jgi:hypothetical protein
MKTIITNLNNEKEYVSLPNPHYEHAASGRTIAAGVWITGLFSGPRSGRKFVRTYSIWDNGRGLHIGTRIKEVDDTEYLDACEICGIYPAHMPASCL